jgi:hypothetical protein
MHVKKPCNTCFILSYKLNSLMQLYQNEPISSTIVVSFAGHGLKFGGNPRPEFRNFLSKNFPGVDVLLLVDYNCRCYHQGLKGLTSNVDETANYIQNIIIGYKKVIFVGVSAGGYASILFGSLLKVNDVIAITPQTKLKAVFFDDTYRDLTNLINSTTNYILIADTSVEHPEHMHHISHCERIEHYANVVVLRKNKVYVGLMRDDGSLLEVFQNVIKK